MGSEGLVAGLTELQVHLCAGGAALAGAAAAAAHAILTRSTQAPCCQNTWGSRACRLTGLSDCQAHMRALLNEHRSQALQ